MLDIARQQARIMTILRSFEWHLFYICTLFCPRVACLSDLVGDVVSSAAPRMCEPSKSMCNR